MVKVRGLGLGLTICREIETTNISDVFIGICCVHSLDLTRLELIGKRTLKITAAAASGDTEHCELGMDGRGKQGVDLIVSIFSQTYTITRYTGVPLHSSGSYGSVIIWSCLQQRADKIESLKSE